MGAKALSVTGGYGRRGEVVAVGEQADRAEEQHDGAGDDGLGAGTAGFPFADGDAEAAAEQDEDDHVDRPAGELELAHANVTEPVKEELQIPEQAGEQGERVVAREARAAGGAEFARGAVARDQEETIHQRGGEGTGVGEQVDDVPLKMPGAVVGRDVGDGLAGGEREAEHRRQHARQHHDGQADAGIKRGRLVGGDGRVVRLAELALLAKAREAGDEGRERAEQHAGDHEAAAGVGKRFQEHAVLDRRDERAEHAGEADGDGVGERKTEVADGGAEGDAAHAVERAEQVGAQHRVLGRLGQHGAELRDARGGEDPRQHEPTTGGLHEPVGLPLPIFDVTLRGVTKRGRGGADGVKQGAEERGGFGVHGAGGRGGEIKNAE